ncbi:DUF4249 domain-containing protein [Algoriphagus sp. AK58]|uniref:DUF4249 domain-containing protein n=1 Tax=Algoriphagus sp. AK58 TaxID=1406877 RepID=UPI00164EFCB5|nr:DUF4249 domain-containing protein [Algoriphagus sp. AK58]MBC6367080.1 DUF4249 domain-containing protein [Algoriphagus sp. AK58]
MGKGWIWFFLLIGIFGGCRTPYDPEIPATELRILVVEGYLDTDGKKSELKLSRTVPLSAEESLVPELGATVLLRGQSGQPYPLSEKGNGIYVFERNLDENQIYVLEIVLKSGERYASEELKPIVTPEIIDGGFRRDSEGVEVFVSTQGNSDADDFLWTFEETWIYRPRIRTSYIYDPQLRDVRFRTAAEQNSLCFKTEPSPDIVLETSSRFQDQVIFQKTVTEIPEGDERIMERYSILISQKGIASKDVQFWEILKKNTEDIGSIFSPLPSLIGGNIKSLDNNQNPVIGQVSLGVIRQIRIYINRSEVSPWNFIDPEFNDCVIGEVAVQRTDYQASFGNGDVVPARELMEGTTIIGFFPSTRRCTDCTLYASPVRPDFWEDN